MKVEYEDTYRLVVDDGSVGAHGADGIETRSDIILHLLPTKAQRFSAL